MAPFDPDLLTAHGEFVRAVVRGVLEDEHLVNDAVQETWLKALRRPPRRAGAWRTWLGRVGRNAAVTLVRGEARRRSRERVAARPEAVPAGPDPLERARAVADAVAALPEPYRTALVERFLEGLSAEGIAKRHGVTAATVRNRVRHGLALLRAEFDRRHGAAWPALFAPLLVPGGRMETAAAAAAGGLLVKGKLMVAGVLAAGVGIGWLIPWQKDAPDRARAEAPRGDTLALEAERDRLRVENLALGTRVQELEARLGAAGAAPATAPATGRGSGDPKDDIDWAKLEAAIARGRATLGRIAEAERDGKTQCALSPEDQAIAQDLILQWNTAAAKARTVTPYPMIDERFLGKIVGTMLGGLLDLSEAQRARAEEEMAALLDGAPAPGGLTPLEAYGLRRRLLAEAGGRIEAMLDARQKEAWRAVAPIWEDLQEGNHRTVRLGLRTEVPRHVQREIAEHYDLDEEQRGRAAEIVGRYVAEGREALRRFGQLGDAPAPLDAAARARLDASLFDLQRRAEREILPLLRPEQLARLRLQPPLLISFEDTGNTNIFANDDRGF